jgi:hypothetical protein
VFAKTVQCRCAMNRPSRGPRKLKSAVHGAEARSPETFAKRSVVIATYSLVGISKADCCQRLRRKASKKTATNDSSPFSPVRFVRELSRKMGMFRVFRGNGLRHFSAVKTCWRRGEDSNLWSPREHGQCREMMLTQTRSFPVLLAS